MNNKANSNPKTTQFRIHYKKLFKTVEQIAKEASDNVLTLQALPSTPYDFGLGKGAAKPMLCETFEHECGSQNEQNQDEVQEQDQTDQLIFNHFEHVVEQANQLFDDCYEDFEKKADELLLNQKECEKYPEAMNDVKKAKEEGQKGESSASSSIQSPSSSQKLLQCNEQNQRSRRSLERDFKGIKENYGAIEGFQDKFTKRPFTACSSMKAHFSTTAKSISPSNRKRELQQPHFTDKWAHFLQETDKSLEKYQKHFDDCLVMKKGKSLAGQESQQPSQPPPLRSVRCVTAGGVGAGINSKIKRSSSSRASNQTIARQQEQSVQIQLFQIVGLLKTELKESKHDDSVNLKEVFLCEKAMNLLLQSVNTSPIDIIADVFSVNKRYIIVHDQKLIAKITQFLQIYSKTKRYVYREICELLLKRLEEQEDQLLTQKQINEQLNENLKELSQRHSEEIQKSRDKLDAQQTECNAKIQQSCGSLNQLLSAARSEIQTLTETVSQLSRQVLTMKSDNSYQMKQTTQEHDHKQVKLLSQLHQLQATKNDSDLQFNQQQDYLTDLINSHSSAIIKLRLNKETIEQQNDKINQLLSEISRLNVRASTQFVDLTPRPSFTELEDVCKALNDPSFRNNELLPRSKFPAMKYSEDDSISKLKKLSKTIKAGLDDYKDCIHRFRDQADNSSPSNNSKIKQRQIKNQFLTKGGSSNRGSEKKIQIDKRNQLGTVMKGTRKNEIIEIDQAPVLSSNLLNISDNLSLSSQDKIALQRQSIDDYEGSFNDFLETKGGKEERCK